MAWKLLTALNYSGGVQSEWMLWMILLGLIERPKYFAVFNADPGMEHSGTAPFVTAMKERCRDAKIDFITAAGPNLLADLLTLKGTNKRRIDNPPLWTPGTRGIGKLKQNCTKHYKIAPMDREIRKWLHNRWGIRPNNSKWLGKQTVEKWIGFTADEKDRAEGVKKYPHCRYVTCRFPLIEAGLTKTDVVNEFLKRDLPIPPRSMCVACPYHGLRSLKEMHDERPADWSRAVEVDDSVRDLTQIGVLSPCYVSQTLVPLKELAIRGFDLGDVVANDLHSCPSGSCFI